jgi:hypothetical protein
MSALGQTQTLSFILCDDSSSVARPEELVANKVRCRSTEVKSGFAALNALRSLGGSGASRVPIWRGFRLVSGCRPPPSQHLVWQKGNRRRN